MEMEIDPKSGTIFSGCCLTRKYLSILFIGEEFSYYKVFVGITEQCHYETPRDSKPRGYTV
jgi:hypothetical protein